MRVFAERQGRAEVETPVDIETAGQSFVGVFRNISVGGVFVATDHLRSVGERVSLKFALPGRERSLSVQAEVRWTREAEAVEAEAVEVEAANQSAPASGMGLRFVNLPVGALISISEFLESRA